MNDMAEKEELFSILSDIYKEAHGIRPRFYNLEEMSIQDLKDEIDRVSEQADEAFKQEQAFQENALIEFKALINDMIEMGARDTETAINWIMDGENDYGYVEFLHNIPYGSIETILQEAK